MCTDAQFLAKRLECAVFRRFGFPRPPRRPKAPEYGALQTLRDVHARARSGYGVENWNHLTRKGGRAKPSTGRLLKLLAIKGRLLATVLFWLCAASTCAAADDSEHSNEFRFTLYP